MRQAFAWAFSLAFKPWSPHTFHPKARSPDPTTTTCGDGLAGLMELGFRLIPIKESLKLIAPKPPKKEWDGFAECDTVQLGASVLLDGFLSLDMDGGKRKFSP